MQRMAPVSHVVQRAVANQTTRAWPLQRTSFAAQQSNGRDAIAESAVAAGSCGQRSADCHYNGGSLGFSGGNILCLQQVRTTMG